MSTDFPRPLVLVVDDDQDTQEMYAMYLRLSGFDVRTSTGADAAFREAVDHQPAVVITDFMLTGGGTGADLCRRLRDDARTAHIPAVLMTGFSRKGDAEAALAAGCAELRIKPYLPDAMVADVNAILARAGDRSQAHIGRQA